MTHIRPTRMPQVLSCWATAGLAAGLVLAPFIAAGANPEDVLEQVNLPKLLDPATREGEARALVGRYYRRYEMQDGLKVASFKLEEFLLVACPQKSSKEVLHTLLARHEPVYETDVPDPNAYQIDKPQELFFPQTATSTLDTPGLRRLERFQWLVLGPDGREIRPFGTEYLLTDYYLADFNGDGIIERLGSNNFGLVRDHCVRVATVRTVERESRTLLSVLYDWHPDDADTANGWDFECFDDDKDGIAEIGFGPRHAAEKREVVFRWNKATGAYVSKEVAKQQRIKVLSNGDPLSDLKAIQAAGGHHYPLVVATDDKNDGKNLPPYRFESMRGRTDEEIVRFMGGKNPPSSAYPEDAPPSSVPAGFWGLPPKDAALEFVAANLKGSKGATMRLAVDDRGGIHPPASGWLVCSSSSARSYTAADNLIALRFGVPNPFLFHCGTSVNGAVCANPIADRSGYVMRLIDLQPAEALQIADLVFWLDRVRSHDPDGAGSSGILGCTGDGDGSVVWQVEGRKPDVTSGTLWGYGYLSSRFSGEYNRETYLNFAAHLMGAAVPERLGERWKTPLELEHRDLTTELEDRLKPREDDAARELLADIATATLTRHRTDPWPPAILEKVAWCAGDCGLSRLLPGLEEIANSLPPPTGEEKEFRKLEDEETRRPGPGEDDGLDERRQRRYQVLRDKFLYDFSCQMRAPLDHAIRQLRAVGNPEKLADMASGDGHPAMWALQQLQLRYPDAYAEVLIGRFEKEDHHGRKLVFSTLAAAYPPGAKRLRAKLTDAQQAELAVELAGFELEGESGLARSRVPALLEIFRDEADQHHWSDRWAAISLLSRLRLAGPPLERFEKLLLEELKKAGSEEVRASVVSEAVRTLMRLSDPGRHWEVLLDAAVSSKDYSDFESLLDALAGLALAKPDPRMAAITGLLRSRLEHCHGMLNEPLVIALALDLRELAPDIARLATPGPEVAEGKGIHTWCLGDDYPGTERYHRARHITALWSETDADTLACMWAAMLVSATGEFVGDAAVPTALRDRFRQVFSAAAPRTRQRVLDLIRAKSESSPPEFAKWLSTLRVVD